MRTRLSGIAFFLLTFCVLSRAGMVDVTSSQMINVPQGATIEFAFALSCNPYPTSLSFQIMGEASDPSAFTRLPGTSQQYDSQFLLDAMLTSANGSSPVMLVNSAATRLGLKSGSMVVTNGAVQGAQTTNVNLISASAQLTAQQAADLFGPSHMAYVVLHNDGPAIELGLGQGYDLRSALVVSTNSGGSGSIGGVTQQVEFAAATAAPEPRTYTHFAGASLILLLFGLKRGGASRRRVSLRVPSSQSR